MSLKVDATSKEIIFTMLGYGFFFFSGFTYAFSKWQLGKISIGVVFLTSLFFAIGLIIEEKLAR